eukprot:13437109-Alexandrium_andersonii.AAC.1
MGVQACSRSGGTMSLSFQRACVIRLARRPARVALQLLFGVGLPTLRIGLECKVAGCVNMSGRSALL